MFRKSLALGIVSGLLAGVAAVIYSRVYTNSLENADFSRVVTGTKLIAVNAGGGVLAAIGFFLLDKWLKTTGEIIFNLLFTLLSFALLLAPFSARLPLDLKANLDLFPGLVIPMHFFPALGWFTLKPIFIRNK